MPARLLPRLLAVAALIVAVVVVAAVVGARHSAPSSPPPRIAAVSRRAHAAAVRHRRRVLPARPAFVVRGARARAAHVPILMYHVVSTPRPGTPNPGLWVTPAAFGAQMRALQQRGFRAITLRRAYAGWTHGTPLPRHPVVVSFDDGYLSDYTHARPVLRALGWPGVLNLVLHNLGPGGITPREVRGLLASGWELDSHTLTHPDLTTVDPARLRHELAGSRAVLRSTFHVPVDFFCYPSGRYDATVEAAVHAAGYLAATTTEEGLADRAQGYALRRIRVQGGESTSAVLAAVGASS